MVEVPVLRSKDKNDDKGVEEVCKSGVECPECLDSTTATATFVKGDTRGGNLCRELRKSLFERGRGGRVALGKTLVVSQPRCCLVLTFQSHDMLARLIGTASTRSVQDMYQCASGYLLILNSFQPDPYFG